MIDGTQTKLTGTKKRIGRFHHIFWYICVYMCRMYVLKIFMHLKHVKRYKCIVQSSAFLVGITVSHLTQRVMVSFRIWSMGRSNNLVQKQQTKV